jgi:hypothetical protein
VSHTTSIECVSSGRTTTPQLRRRPTHRWHHFALASTCCSTQQRQATPISRPRLQHRQAQPTVVRRNTTPARHRHTQDTIAHTIALHFNAITRRENEAQRALQAAGEQRTVRGMHPTTAIDVKSRMHSANVSVRAHKRHKANTKARSVPLPTATTVVQGRNPQGAGPSPHSTATPTPHRRRPRASVTSAARTPRVRNHHLKLLQPLPREWHAAATLGRATMSVPPPEISGGRTLLVSQSKMKTRTAAFAHPTTSQQRAIVGCLTKRKLSNWRG